MDQSEKLPPENAANDCDLPDRRPTPTVNSEDLMHGATELQIHHRGEIYRLRITRSGKLILQK